MITQNIKICYYFFMIDLHSHSTASDGELSPSELVNLAIEKNLKALAITDHDTFSGLEEGKNAAKNSGLIFIPGIELNIERTRGEFHLLGLGLKEPSYSLIKICNMLQEGRLSRNQQIIEKMQQDGFPVNYEELKEMFPVPTLGRPHVAAYLVNKKIVKKRQLAFDKYLGKGRPYYVDRSAANLYDAIYAIKDSGGVPILAHPLSLYVSWGKMEETLRDLKEAGIEGLEAWHPGTRVGEALRLEEMAKKLGFFVTAGSDFHGPNVRADRKLGHTTGNRKIDDRFYTEELLSWL